MEQAKVAILEWRNEGSVRSISAFLNSGLPTNLIILHSFFDDQTKNTEVAKGLKDLKSDVLIVAIPSDNIFSIALSLIPLVKKLLPNLPILAALELEKSEASFKLLGAGVDDFAASTVSPLEILLRIRRLLMKRNIKTPENNAKERLGLSQLVGKNKAFLSEIGKITILARCDTCVLITGETGTGKELCARAIHYLSRRSSEPFIPVNCGAIPVDLIENELFGHERGAFTGASSSQTGLIQEAEGGTMLLDEIDCLPHLAQVKLLRFLQEKEYRPLGSSCMRYADVRLLASMNLDLNQAMDSGRLRQDLYYRLNVISLNIPPLRERPEDIPLLARYFLRKFAREFTKNIVDFSDEVMQLLLSHPWPGNVRELEHIVERAALLSTNEIIDAKDIYLSNSQLCKQDSFRSAKAKTISAFEKNYIEGLLTVHQGNISSAARAAQKNRRAFWELIRKHQINTQNFKPRM